MREGAVAMEERADKLAVRLCLAYEVFLCVAGLVFVVAAGLGSLNVPAFYRFTRRGVASPATVIELLPNDHAKVRYEYSIGGRAFKGGMQSWPPNPKIEELKVGHEVVIYYDREHPEKSVRGELHAMLENELSAVIAAALVMPTVLIWRLRWWIRRRRGA